MMFQNINLTGGVQIKKGVKVKMDYVVLFVLLVLGVANLVVALKLLSLIDTIKKYQYINNLKLLGFIKKELNSTVYHLKTVSSIKRREDERRKNV